MRIIKKVIITVVSLLLTVCLAALGVLIYAFSQPDVYQHTFTAALADKYDRLTATDDPKIVLIGGSSMPFGIRSDLMERELKDYKVVNFGLYAALGSKLMLELSQANLNEGDIVVFAPEYSPQLWSEYFDAATTLQAFDVRRGLAFELPFGDYWLPLVNAYPEYLKHKAELLAAGIPDPQDVYKRSAFNEYGDISYGRPYNILPDLYLTTDKVTIAPEIVDDAFVEYFNDYAGKLARKGVRTCISFAPVNALALGGGTPESRLAFYDFCRETFDAEVISNVEDYVMDARYFYDSNYHLNDAGAVYRTALLVGDLKRTLNDTTPIGIGIPDAPEVPDDEGGDGENSDGENFVFEVADNGKIVIRGLSAAGKKKSYLKIPSRINGTAVYKLDDNALAGAPLTERVDIPSSLKSFGDRVFANSPQLTAVYLGLSPQLSAPLPSVGSDLLGGASPALKIYVAKSQYSRMVADYFWSRYKDGIAPMD